MSTRKAVYGGAICVFALWLIAGVNVHAEKELPVAHLLDLNGAIGPATVDYVERGLQRAADSGAPVVVLRIDTPGGLDTATRDIVQAILASPVPVIGYVAPQGARAASAGTYILYACHVAAMAPATSVGAATPVQIGAPGFPSPTPSTPLPTPPTETPDGAGDSAKDADSKPQEVPKPVQEETGNGVAAPDNERPPVAKRRTQPQGAMERKVVNDAVAFIRGLALMRERNAEWAELAVRDGASLTASDALQRNVVDLIAPDVASLLDQVHGTEVEVAGERHELATDGLSVAVLAPDWRSELLAIITNPNVAYLLMLLGVYGLFFELSNPGNILPGVAGAISLTLALYAFQVLPVNYAGAALIALGIAFMLGEAFVPSFGALGIGGAIAFAVGSLILVETGSQAFAISIPLVVTVAVVSALFFVGVMNMALRQRRRPVATGREQLIGSVGEAVDDFETNGTIQLLGEYWSAHTDSPVTCGQSVRVRAVHDLTVEVEAAN